MAHVQIDIMRKLQRDRENRVKASLVQQVPAKIRHRVCRRFTRLSRDRAVLYTTFEEFFFAEVEEYVDACYAEGYVVDHEPSGVWLEVYPLDT
jgi:hypothetical protein